MLLPSVIVSWLAADVHGESSLVAVNGIAYSGDTIEEAITAAKDTDIPIELLVKRGDTYRTVAIDYHGGLRYPWLEPAGDGEQPLDRFLEPRAGG